MICCGSYNVSLDGFVDSAGAGRAVYFSLWHHLKVNPMVNPFLAHGEDYSSLIK